jgi:hypothetical protein
MRGEGFALQSHSLVCPLKIARLKINSAQGCTHWNNWRPAWGRSELAGYGSASHLAPPPCFLATSATLATFKRCHGVFCRCFPSGNWQQLSAHAHQCVARLACFVCALRFFHIKRGHGKVTRQLTDKRCGAESAFGLAVSGNSCKAATLGPEGTATR